MNANFPIGADLDPHAPWNEPDPIEYKHEATVSEWFTRDVSLITFNEEPDCKELEDAYCEQYYTMQSLLCELEQRIAADLEDEQITRSERKRLKDMLNQVKSFAFKEITIE